MKSISLIGSTGSVGCQTLDVARRLGMRVSAIAAGSNAGLIERQAREFSPRVAALFDEKAALELRGRLADTGVKVLSGAEGVCECARLEDADIVVNAATGSHGLMPTMAAISAKKNLALANKESLVMAGKLVMEECGKNGVTVLPVDSEHSAIFQCLRAGGPGEVKELWLTASGGPFFGKSTDELKNVTPEMALRHPNWNMGSRITVDSASLINKGFEVIEARWLFGIEPENIRVLVHPQSIVHSMVLFRDGNVIAQLADPDMRRPIQYALCFPERLEAAASFDLTALSALEFRVPDHDTFPGIRLALAAYKKGGNACAVLNGADQAAVKAFLHGKIGFSDIYRMIETALERVAHITDPTIFEIAESCAVAEKFVESLVEE